MMPMKGLDMSDYSEEQMRVLGQKLRDARERRGLKQEDAAQLINASRTTITAIEQGKRQVSAIELAQLAHGYGREVSDFLREESRYQTVDIQFRAAQPDIKVPEETTEEFKALSMDYYDLEQIINAPSVFNYPPEYRVDNLQLEQAAEIIANRERMRLGLGDQPIGSNFRDILEKEVGLRVFYLYLGAVSGMYFYTDAIGGCMAINRNQPEERRRWNLAHEYAHFLTSRYEPDITVYSDEGEAIKPKSERMADAFARFFLMPTSSLTIRFNNMVQQASKFSIAALCILANEYGVSFQAMTLRLEHEKLLPTGTYARLQDRNFHVGEAQEKLGLTPVSGRDDVLPVRYRYLAVAAYDSGLINEGRLARLLRVDRVEARAIIQAVLGE